MIGAMAYEKPRTIRRDLTPRERDKMFAAQGGKCGCDDPTCTRDLGDNFIAEHVLPVGLLNEEKPTALLSHWCAYLKTANEDMPRMSKADRQGGRTGPQARRERARAAGKPPPIPSRPFPPGHRPLPSRPFPKRRKDDV